MRPSAGVVRSALVGTLAYLARPVLGWGGVAAFFSHPARTTVAIITVALSVYFVRHSDRIEDQFRDWDGREGGSR